MITKEDKSQTKKTADLQPETKDLTGILTKSLCFQERKLLSESYCLCLWEVFFLGTAYLTENAKINNELTFQADDGLGSDIPGV